MKLVTIDADMSVDEIMRRWPATIRVFMRRRMLCIGCPVGRYHTVADVSATYDLDKTLFTEELLAAMRRDASVSFRSPPARPKERS